MIDKNGMQDQEIHKVAKSGDFLKLKELISNEKQLIHANGWFGMKPLHYAAQSMSINCVKYLIDNGAYVHSKCVVNESTPIFEASTPEIVELLMQNGATLNVVSTKGRTPLDSALQTNNLGVTKILIKYGADVNFKNDQDFFRTMTQWVLCEVVPNHETRGTEKIISTAEEILKVLLEAGANPNQQSVSGTTVLHTAITKKLTSIVKLLLEYKADPCIRDVSGSSCFDYTDDEKILKLIEPLRLNLVEIVKVQDDFDELIKRLIATGKAKREEFVVCSEEQINQLEKDHKVILPEEYKKFLRVMGGGAGDYLKSDHWEAFLPDFDGNLGIYHFPSEEEYLQDGEEPVVMPKDFFVFASRLGEWDLGFFADGKDNNPIIYRIDDYANLKKSYDTIWGFIQEMVEYYEYFSNPKNFSQNKESTVNQSTINPLDVKLSVPFPLPNYEPQKTKINKWWKFW